MDAVYAAAIASAEQSKLVGAERLSRMIESGSAAEALRILSECGFGGGALAERGLDGAIAAETAALCELVRSFAPSRAVRRYLLAEYDYHNAEALARAKHAHLDEGELLGPEGDFPVSRLREAVSRGEYGGLPTPLAEALAKTEELFAEGGADGFALGTLFVRAEYAELAEAVRKNAFLKDALSFRADALNVLAALRAGSAAAAGRSFLPGGELGTEALLKIFAERDLRSLSGTRLEELAEAAEHAGRGPYPDAERIADDYATARLKERRFEIDGALPFLLYALEKKNELKNVRIAVSGLSAGLDRRDIRARLRECYDG